MPHHVPVLPWRIIKKKLLFRVESPSGLAYTLWRAASMKRMKKKTYTCKHLAVWVTSIECSSRLPISIIYIQRRALWFLLYLASRDWATQLWPSSDKICDIRLFKSEVWWVSSIWIDASCETPAWKPTKPSPERASLCYAKFLRYHQTVHQSLWRTCLLISHV